MKKFMTIIVLAFMVLTATFAKETIYVPTNKRGLSSPEMKEAICSHYGIEDYCVMDITTAFESEDEFVRFFYQIVQWYKNTNIEPKKGMTTVTFYDDDKHIVVVQGIPNGSFVIWEK